MGKLKYRPFPFSLLVHPILRACLAELDQILRILLRTDIERVIEISAILGHGVDKLVVVHARQK